MRTMRALLLVGAIVGAIATVGCGTASDHGVDSVAAGTETVALSVDHRSEWRRLWIEGTTDLPDGAFVNYSVTHELGETTPADEWPVPNLVASGRATVKNGQYWSTINTLNWPRGNVRVLVQFPLPPQPPEVEARYGPFGEHLTGENVTSLVGMKAIEVEHRFEHRR